jgi:hypothetical protein
MESFDVFLGVEVGLEYNFHFFFSGLAVGLAVGESMICCMCERFLECFMFMTGSGSESESEDNEDDGSSYVASLQPSAREERCEGARLREGVGDE